MTMWVTWQGHIVSDTGCAMLQYAVQTATLAGRHWLGGMLQLIRGVCVAWVSSGDQHVELE